MFDVEVFSTEEIDGAPMTIIVESVTFEDEDDAYDWADDMGYLNHPEYNVSIYNVDTCTTEWL